MLLLLFAFGAGSFLPALNIVPMWRVAVGTTHYLVLDGLVLMLLVYLMILAIDTARRRFGASIGLSTLALVLALALGFAMKFGLMDRAPGF